MLDFLRRHQRYFFGVITTVIIISFSFFGVMQAMMTSPPADPTAFTAVDGTAIKRRQLELMAFFLSSDADDKVYFGGVNGPNFLNDGFVKKDLLETGVAALLIQEFKPALTPDFALRFGKEQRYQLYRHPKADFISVENAWGYIAPDMRQNFRNLKNSDSPFEPEAISARIALYLGERKLSPQMVKQMLLYQKKQYGWLEEDPNLYRADLSLFGYHTLEDWFGQNFLKLAAAVVMNVAKEAENQGFRVTDEEALADLVQNAEKSYAQNKNSQHMTESSADSYLKAQLARMGMTVQDVTAIWKNVLLYRRLVTGTSDAVMFDTLAAGKFADFAGRVVAGESFQLPEELRLANFRDLQRLEAYLQAVSKAAGLELPNTTLSPEEVAKNAPELVEREWTVKVAPFDAGQLEERVSVKETWEWQSKESSFQKLAENFPELRVADRKTEESRFAAIEALNSDTRERLDRFSRQQIAAGRPEWIRESIAAVSKEERQIGIRESGDTPFKGVKESRPLLQLFEAALKGDKAAIDQLSLYTQDGRHYFSIEVVSKKNGLSLIPFATAKKDGAINDLVKRKLEAHYAAIRSAHPDLYRAASGEWKPLSDVREEVAKDYFSKTLTAIAKANPKKSSMTVDEAASARLFPYVAGVQTALANGASEDSHVRDANEAVTLGNQWKLVKTPLNESRAKAKEESPLFHVAAGTWSEVVPSPDGALSFSFIKSSEVENRYALLLGATLAEKRVVGNELKRDFMGRLLKEQQEKQPIVFDYMLER